MAGAAVLAQENAAVQAVSARDERRVSEALRLIEAEAEQPITVAGLARVVAMSPYHFLRTFSAVAGVTPHQFILGLRLRRAGVRLRQSNDPITDIAFDAGFGDLSSFNRPLPPGFGVTPGAWRRQARP